VTALFLAFWLITKFKNNQNLRPERLYLFMRALVYLGGTIMAFSGFVYVVYSWLYGNLPVAVFMKGAVAFVIVGMVALYFSLTADGKNPHESVIGKMFASFLVLVTLFTLVFSFSVIGTPAQARMYRLDNITLQNMLQVKNEIDNQDQNFGNKIQDLSQLTSEYVQTALKQSHVSYSTTDSDYTLCANFNGDMPATINMGAPDHTWDYHMGNSCFTFKHLPTYATANINPGNIPKPVYVR
jgi:hypothetical protein